MRIATLILGIVVSLVLILQSCAIVAASLVRAGLSTSGPAIEASIASSVYGISAGVLCAVATAFVMRGSIVSVFVYGLGGAIALLGAERVPGLQMWGWVLITLCLLSVLTRHRPRKEGIRDEDNR